MSDAGWPQPPELHRQRVYDATDIDAFIRHITARVAELERRWAAAGGPEPRRAPPFPAAPAAAEAGPEVDLRLSEAERLAHAVQAEIRRHASTGVTGAERQAQPPPDLHVHPAERPSRAPPPDTERLLRERLADADRLVATRLADADRQVAALLAEAHREAEIVLERARAEGRALVDTVRRSLNEAVRQKDEEVLTAVGESHERVLALLEEKLRSRDEQPPPSPYQPSA